MKNIVIVTPDANHIKKDYTGAFRPNAKKFSDLHQLEGNVHLIRFKTELVPVLRARELNHELAKIHDISLLAFFCHGYKHGLQTGHSLRLISARSVGALAESLNMARDGNIVLYACDAGRDMDQDEGDEVVPGPGGEGGFASELAFALGPDWRGHVNAHSTAGHTTTNPYVRRFFRQSLSRGPDSGHWIIEPNTGLFKKWRRELRTPRSSLKYRFPTMLSADIRKELLLV